MSNMFAAEFLIDYMTIDQVDFDGFSFEQLASSYYVPVEIMKLKFNYIKP